MSVIKEEKSVTVEQTGHASGAKATVTENGKTGKAEGRSLEEAVAEAAKKAKD